MSRRSILLGQRKTRQTFILGRRRLKAISPSVDSLQETSSDFASVSISRFTVSMQNSNRIFQAKLHVLTSSVVSKASSHPIPIQEEKLRQNTSICVFYIPDKFHLKHSFHSTDFYNSDHPQGLTPHLQHYITSSETLLHYQSNGITPGPSFSMRPTGSA